MKRSIISQIEKLEEVQENLTCLPHIVLGMDLNDNGDPHGAFYIAAGCNVPMLGMIDQMMDMLKREKKKLLTALNASKKVVTEIPNLEKITTDYQAKRDGEIKNKTASVDELIKKLPPDVAEKITDFKKRMEEAVEKGDLIEVMKIKKDLDDFAILKRETPPAEKKEDVKTDDEEFDINAHKGD